MGGQGVVHGRHPFLTIGYRAGKYSICLFGHHHHKQLGLEATAPRKGIAKPQGDQQKSDQGGGQKGLGEDAAQGLAQSHLPKGEEGSQHGRHPHGKGQCPCPIPQHDIPFRPFDQGEGQDEQAEQAGQHGGPRFGDGLLGSQTEQAGGENGGHDQHGR